MRQENLVRLELDGVAENSVDEVHAVEGVVLQRVARVRGHGLVVAVDLVQRRMGVVRLIRRRSDDDLRRHRRKKVQFLAHFNGTCRGKRLKIIRSFTNLAE